MKSITMKSILVAYDGSAPADKAFSLGLDMAAKYGAEVRVLAVSRPPEYGEDVETEAVIENSKQHYHDILKPLQPVAEASGVKVHFHVVVGHPAEQIVRHADEWKTDMIIIGHRGKTLMERWMIGSVAKNVINHAACAVLITH